MWRKYSQSVHWNAFCGALRKKNHAIISVFSRQRDPSFDLSEAGFIDSAAVKLRNYFVYYEYEVVAMSVSKTYGTGVILDGYAGYREEQQDNAILNAKTPVMDALWAKRPHTPDRRIRSGSGSA